MSRKFTQNSCEMRYRNGLRAGAALKVEPKRKHRSSRTDTQTYRQILDDI